jgi:opacity protein-like surface antigen
MWSATRMRMTSGPVLASLFISTTVAAQHAGLSYAIGAGLTAPTGDFHADSLGAGYKTGWQGEASVNFRLSKTSLGIRVEGSYSANSANDQLKVFLRGNPGQPDDSKTKMLGGNVDLNYEFRSSSPMTAYVLAGIGLYNFKISLMYPGNRTSDTSTTKFAFNGGAGLSYRIRGAGLFLETRYFDISSPFGGSDIKYVPITAGVRFGSQ